MNDSRVTDDGAPDAARVLAWLRERVPHARIARVGVTPGRDADRPHEFGIEIHTARPEALIGWQGATLAAVSDDLAAAFGARCRLHLVEVDRPDVEPLLIAEVILANIERSIDPASAMRRLARAAIRCGARYCRIAVTGAVTGEHHDTDGSPVPDASAGATATETRRLPSGDVTCHVRVVLAR